jgi:hypothetical protein
LSLHPRDLRRLLTETYATHCVLLNLGFPNEEIFVGALNVLNGDPPGMYACVILRRGGLQFICNFSQLAEEDCDEYLRAWSAFSQVQPSMDRDTLEQMVRTSSAWAGRSDLLAALAVKGFSFPAVSN